MPVARPLLQDRLDSNAGAVVAACATPADGMVPCRTPVTHSYAALAFYTAGRSRLRMGTELHVREGDVVLVPSGHPHCMLESQRVRYWGASFSAPAVLARGDASLLEPFERVRDGAAPVVAIPAARHDYLATLFRELSAPGGSEAVRTSLLTLIMAEVGAATGSQPLPATSSGLVTRALRFIERNCLRPLTLQDIADAVGRSPAHVTHALSRATGQSAVQWIVSGRLAEARRLLLHSSDRVDAIAERIGYADATHFIRLFRRHHGVTPAAWRASALRSRLTPS